MEISFHLDFNVAEICCTDGFEDVVVNAFLEDNHRVRSALGEDSIDGCRVIRGGV